MPRPHNPNAASRTPVHFCCRICGKPFVMMASYVTAYQKRFGKNPEYCSRACFSAARITSTDDRSYGNCQQCGGPIRARRDKNGHPDTPRKTQQFCSPECHYENVRSQGQHPDFPGYKLASQKARHGYVRLQSPWRKGAKKEALLHRLVMEKHLGRQLLPGETVHHRDGDRKNNDLTNLELWWSNHGPGQRVSDKVRWAIELLKQYPEFAEEQGYEIVTTQDAKLIESIKYPDGKWKNSPNSVSELTPLPNTGVP